MKTHLVSTFNPFQSNLGHYAKTTFELVLYVLWNNKMVLLSDLVYYNYILQLFDITDILFLQVYKNN